MDRGWKSGVGLLVLLGSVFVIARFLETTDSLEPHRTGSVPPAASTRPEPAAEDMLPPVAAALPPAPAAEPSRLSASEPVGGNRWVRGEVVGRIVDLDGQPLPGARVTVLPTAALSLPGLRMPDASDPGGHVTAPSVTCDADG